MASLREVKGKLDEELDKVRIQMESLQPQVEEAEAVRSRREEELRAAHAELEQLRGEIGPWREDLEKARAHLAQEQGRTQELERQIEEEQSKGKKSVLAQQLAVALEEAEQANEELQRTRAQLEAVNGAKADIPLAKPEPEAPIPEAVSEESAVSDAQRVCAVAQGHGEPRRLPIGELLLQAKIISQDQLNDAVDRQRSDPNSHLGAILVECSYAGEEAVAQALACQCGADFIRIAEDTVDAEAAALINERLAKQHQCVPIQATSDKVVLAMADPLDLLAIEDVERATNREVEVAVATPSELCAALNRYYWEPE